MLKQARPWGVNVCVQPVSGVLPGLRNWIIQHTAVHSQWCVLFHEMPGKPPILRRANLGQLHSFTSWN